MNTPKYPKVLKRGRLFLRSHLLDAGDHLLYVEGVFQERVRRFYYKDIQAVLWSKHSAAMVLRVVAVILCTLPGVGFLLSPEPVMSLIFLLPALGGFIRLLWVQGKGGYCICCVVTAAQGQNILAAYTVPRAMILADFIRKHPDVST